MMISGTNVVTLEANLPHETGRVRCWACSHEWIGVAPVRRRNDAGLECPRCHDLAGVFLMSPAEVESWFSNVAQLLDGWHCDTAWSEWDEALRADLTRAQVTVQKELTRENADEP